LAAFGEQRMTRLRRSMERSEADLRRFNEKRLDALREYVGHNYGEQNAHDKVPVPLLEIAVATFTRMIAARPPRVLCRPLAPALRAGAADLELALNYLVKQINLLKSLNECAKAAMFGIGVMKVGIAVSDQSEDEQGILNDPGQAFADPILQERFIYDTAAKRYEEVDYAGDRYTLPLELIRDNDSFDKKVR